MSRIWSVNSCHPDYAIFILSLNSFMKYIFADRVLFDYDLINEYNIFSNYFRMSQHALPKFISNFRTHQRCHCVQLRYNVSQLASELSTIKHILCTMEKQYQRSYSTLLEHLLQVKYSKLAISIETVCNFIFCYLST